MENAVNQYVATVEVERRLARDLERLGEIETQKAMAVQEKRELLQQGSTSGKKKTTTTTTKVRSTVHVGRTRCVTSSTAI